MKFSNGNWLMREGVSVTSPVQVHDVECGRDQLVVYAATRPLVHRGATLGSAIITMRLSSPME